MIKFRFYSIPDSSELLYWVVYHIYYKIHLSSRTNFTAFSYFAFIVTNFLGQAVLDCSAKKPFNFFESLFECD